MKTIIAAAALLFAGLALAQGHFAHSWALVSQADDTFGRRHCTWYCSIGGEYRVTTGYGYCAQPWL